MSTVIKRLNDCGQRFVSHRAEREGKPCPAGKAFFSARVLVGKILDRNQSKVPLSLFTRVFRNILYGIHMVETKNKTTKKKQLPPPPQKKKKKIPIKIENRQPKLFEPKITGLLSKKTNSNTRIQSTRSGLHSRRTYNINMMFSNSDDLNSVFFRSVFMT